MQNIPLSKVLQITESQLIKINKIPFVNLVKIKINLILKGTLTSQSRPARANLAPFKVSVLLEESEDFTYFQEKIQNFKSDNILEIVLGTPKNINFIF